MFWIAIAALAFCVFHVEAQSLTCDSTTDVCPGTELTCTCSVGTPVLVWNVPISATITFTGGDGIDSTDATSDGVFFAIVTDDTGGGKESILKYNATEPLVNGNAECEDGNGNINSTTITVTITDPPSVPDTVSVQSTTYNSATIQWTEPSDNGGPSITGYNITISPPPSVSCSTGTCTVSGDTLQYTFTGLDHRINYNISVAAINCAGTGDSTSTLLVIEAIVLPPTQVDICVKKFAGSNNFIISWEAPPFNALAPPVINYTININGDDKGTSISSPFEYSINITNGVYDISVSTNNDAGQSQPVTVENIPVSGDIFNIEVVNTTSSSITLVCNSNISDIGVRCNVTLTANEASYNEINRMINENIVFESLSPGTNYTYLATLTGVPNVCYQIESTVTTNGTATPVTTTMTTAPAPTASSSAPPTSGGTEPSPTPGITDPPSAANVALIGGVAGGVGGGVCLAVVAVIILAVCICCCKKPRSKGEDGLTLSEYKPKRDDPEAFIERDPVPETGQSGPMYQDPNTIERQQAPTGDFYALPEKRTTGSRRQPPAAPTELATYQDPSTIQHETAPTGALYAMPDKKPAGIAKQDDRMYAALEFENGTGSASTSFQQGKPRPPDVLYSEVQQQP